MIKIKAYSGQLNEFVKYLKHCAETDVFSTDSVKEYFLCYSINELQIRIIKKLFALTVETSGDCKLRFKPINITIHEPEIIALSIFFNRFPVHPYISGIENDIVSQIPPGMISILKPLQTLNNYNYDTEN